MLDLIKAMKHKHIFPSICCLLVGVIMAFPGSRGLAFDDTRLIAEMSAMFREVGQRDIENDHNTADDEIRIWALNMAYPQSLLRVTVSAKDVSGSLYLLWKNIAPALYERSKVHWRCKSFHDGKSRNICLSDPVEVPDWKRVLTELESHSVWNIGPQPPPSAEIVLDGHGILIQRIRAGAYSHTYCSNPDSYATPSDKEAEAIYQIAMKLLRTAAVK